MTKKNSSLSLYELSKNDKQGLDQGRRLFLNYFMDLYKDISQATLQINNTTETYLISIFDKTERFFLNNPTLAAFLMYKDEVPIGFTVFGPLETHETVLMHTLPISLDHKELEAEIRTTFMNYVPTKFPASKRIIIMVRKANNVHQRLCNQTGCKEYNEIFETSTYIRTTYDINCYNAYVYDLTV